MTNWKGHRAKKSIFIGGLQKKVCQQLFTCARRCCKDKIRAPARWKRTHLVTHFTKRALSSTNLFLGQKWRAQEFKIDTCLIFCWIHPDLFVKIHQNLAQMDYIDDVDIREQMFHNAVREYIVSCPFFFQCFCCAIFFWACDFHFEFSLLSCQFVNSSGF